MIIRVRSPAGMKRIDVQERSFVEELFKAIENECGLEPDTYTLTKEGQASPLPRKPAPVSSLGLRHGDIINVKLAPGVSMGTGSGSAGVDAMDTDGPSRGKGKEPMTQAPEMARPTTPSVVGGGADMDPVDQILRKQTGLIKRGYDKQMCKHSKNGMCDHCMDLEPWDNRYLEENNIKHMSFHAWVRMLSRGADKGKFTPLNDIRCTIKEGCKDHPPWPQGICTQCQPSAITLKRQVYRHVDFIEFESPVIVNQFVEFWRKSGGCQRIGFLYGRYAPFQGVPLGIQAKVTAIYEPAQYNDPASVQLLDDKKLEMVEQVARWLELERVGWVFTDLEDDGTNQGTVFYKRHKDSFFLTSLECMLAAEQQLAHMSPWPEAAGGKFGSKFVTVVISGDSTNHVGIEAYQVSDQAMALQRDKCLLPSSKDGKGRIKKTTAEQYVPEVFYSFKNEYGTDQNAPAKPAFPLDYMLVNVSSGAPQVPAPMFHSAVPGHRAFPRENRDAIGEVQSLKALKQHIDQSPSFLAAVSDFHLLAYLATDDVLSIGDKVQGLCEAVLRQDPALAEAWRQQPAWQTVEMMMADPDSFQSLPGSAEGGAGDMGREWQCRHCTFINNGGSDCEMCGLPQ